MKSPFWACACAFLYLSGAAHAADYLRTTLEPPPPPPPPEGRTSWTGLYLGGQVGYASDSVSGTGWAGNQLSTIAKKNGHDGFIGAVHAGLLYQASAFNLPIVIGGQVDLGASSIHNSVLRLSAVARFGYAYERLLFYGLGGLAVSDFQYNMINASGVLLSNNTVTSAGWTLGAGVEYAITDDWSARVEYRYADFGGITLGGTYGEGGVRRTENMILTGVSYHVNIDPPRPQAPQIPLRPD